MHVNIRFFLVAVATCAVMATSCVKDVILDAMDEPTVVVDCVLSDEPEQTLHLVYTKGASRAEAPDLPEATAVLTDLTEGKEVGRFTRTADRSWTLAYAAIPSHRYRLDVTVPGHEPIWAEQTMPEPPGVEVGWHSWDPRSTSESHSVGYTFRFTHQKDPVWFCGRNYPTLESPGEATPYLCTDSPVVDPFNKMEDSPYREESEFNYLWGDSSGSGLRTTRYPDLDGLPKHKRYLRFPVQEEPAGETFQVSGFFRGYISDKRDFVHAKIRPAELHWFSASEDYDRFLQDSYQIIDLKTSTNLADIFVRDNVYSNIHGAIGLFGARVERRLEWEGRDSWYANGYFLLASFATQPLADADGMLSSHFFDTGSILPFELLHYEFCLNEPFPDWAPEWDYGFHPVEVIRDESQLAAHGIVLDRPVDFTNKVVLYCAMPLNNLFPFVIGYGDDDASEFDWNPALHGPLVGLLSCVTEGNDAPFTSAFRFAILVDKEEEFAPYIVQQGGVTIWSPTMPAEAVSLIKKLYQDGYSPFEYK